jgi:iron complex outermembrane receptor protein
MQRLTLVLAGLGTCAATAPCLAQQATPASAPERSAASRPDSEESTIVVVGTRPEGSVIGDIAPEVTFSPGDIRSLGVSSLSDLIAEISPQTTSGQGRGGESPVVLLNGKRISSFSEVRDIPTEAIQRVEVLPEEVALKYGYRSNQKVVNVVLRKRFNAFTAELEGTGPTAGGRFTPEAEAAYLRIGEAGRLNLAAHYERSSALFENERDILPQASSRPYALGGNITAAALGSEIDPALSALLGRNATVIGAPASASTRAPTLADFAGGGVNETDLRPFRTLLPQTDSLTLNATYARSILGNVAASFNGRFTYDTSESAQGLPGAALTLPSGSPFSPFANATTLYRYFGNLGPLSQESRDVTGHFGTTLSDQLGRWQWSFTGNLDYRSSRTDTDSGIDTGTLQARLNALDLLANPFADLSVAAGAVWLTDRARSTSKSADAQLVFSGPLLRLPAGKVTASFSATGSTSDLDSSAVRSGLSSSAALSRDALSGQMSFDIPLASRKNGFLAPLGELTANLNLAYDHYSDFGGQRTIGAGLNWTPVKAISLIASFSKDEGAPTMQQLGNPLVATANVRVFDYIRGETVDITRLSGGNPALSADDRRVIKLGLTLKPFTQTDLTFSANYTNSRVRDPILAFPTATAAIEAAFPDRFTRDAGGRLTMIDSRPVNFARQDSEEIRWGINFSKQISAPPPQPGGARDGAQPSLRDLVPQGPNGDRPPEQPGAGAGSGGGASGSPGGGAPGGGPPGGGFGRGPGGRGTRVQFAIYHTVHLREEFVIRDSIPVLDLLNGAAIGNSGGQPRHEVQVQTGLMHNGMGIRFSANWQSGTTVDGGTGGTQSLRLSDLATFNLRLFANLGQQQSLTTRWPFLRGTRFSIGINNLFDARMRVRDASGATPASYQPDYLNPLGRTVSISFRKLFFTGGPPQPPR